MEDCERSEEGDIRIYINYEDMYYLTTRNSTLIRGQCNKTIKEETVKMLKEIK